MNALALVTWMLVSADGGVVVEVKVTKPLAVKKGELTGRLDVKVTNGGAEAVTLEHRDVHGFRFAPPDGGTPEVLFHSCDCGFELGLEKPPAARTFTLAPKASRTLTFDDFACGGGPYKAPPKGAWLVTYSVGAPSPAPASDGGLDLPRCEALVRGRGPAAWQSKPTPATIR